MWKSGKRREGTTAARESERVREEREREREVAKFLFRERVSSLTRIITLILVLVRE